jgi:hypothetical protein
MRYQIFSERCSGSNFFKASVSRNLPGLTHCNEYGFKHWITDKFLDEQCFPADLVFCIVIRNPFNWLRSLHGKPWHCSSELRTAPFSDFIRTEWKCIWDEQAGVKQSDPRWMTEIKHERNPFNKNARFKNALEMRTVKYSLWRTKLSKTKAAVHISLERFIESPEDTVELICQLSNISPPPRVNLPREYKGRASWKRRLLAKSSLGLIAIRPESRKEPIKLEDLEFIRDNLDKDNEKRWGYDIDRLFKEERDYTLASGL